ncbi:RluA family pseudouridine synthase [Limosilactobacillus sp. STM2_1]|uniref:RNA pseudouridylate synthase n=1 Tax=Limosilactobacillus rudii TaxID=2759755 RepID=A0A7W3UKT2_9LACO|nr:RluA family pseudouridine synthase [Limosilactobacillus rudii]MBB1079312.1 RluA family pseudouridine synthase [Limosilactobacillus rudii]MBB1097358.1 RluA family pseudouridine synthase [Limosilactobacillus rudii]MCD7134467.1 RluA family pseudouridine synthase [Limosilactobacillus rudii]
MPFRWQFEEVLGKGQQEVSLRSLLHEQWLLPNRLIHYLRIRQNIEVNGQYYSMNRLVCKGDSIKFGFIGDEIRTPDANDYIPTAKPHLEILYENRDLLVVNKPQGQKTHPNYHGEKGTLMNDVAGYLAGSSGGAYMVHRIDLQTSGAVIVAKNPIVVPILNRLISDGKIHRSYLAVVEGKVTGKGQMNWPIGKDPLNSHLHQVNGLNAQPALTYYQSLASNGRYSLLSLQLATGRTHQLRVHLAYSGHPIVGDPLYNPASQEKMLLHGVAQKLVLPFVMKSLNITAPLPSYFKDYLVKYNLAKKQS